MSPATHCNFRWRSWLTGWLLVCVSLPWFTGCHSPATPALQRYEFTKPQMGTLFTLTFYARNPETAERAAAAAFGRVADLNRVMSDYDPESELLRLCKSPVGEPVPISDDLFAVLQASQEIAARTDGAFDVTVGPMVQLWRRARRQHKLPAEEKIIEAQQAVGWRNLRLEAHHQTATLLVPNMRLDVGGIGKGFAADHALAVLRKHGINRAMVAASGDLAMGDPPPGKPGWVIGIGSIDAQGNELTKVVQMRNAAVSTSGDTEQFVELNGRRYSHIVDPKTGVGLTDRIGVTVIARTGTLTDGYDTAMSVMGVKRALELAERDSRLAALIVHLDSAGHKQVIESSRFKKLKTVDAGRE